MNNTVNVPPRRKVESHTAYVAVNTMDSSDRFMIIADSETHAKFELLDKLGYTLVERLATGRFILLDVDTQDEQAELNAVTLEGALDEVLKAARWRIQEPMDMVGGSLGQGFEEVDDE